LIVVVAFVLFSGSLRSSNNEIGERKTKTKLTIIDKEREVYKLMWNVVGKVA
jgi:hypothetical protein